MAVNLAALPGSEQRGAAARKRTCSPMRITTWLAAAAMALGLGVARANDAAKAPTS